MSSFSFSSRPFECSGPLKPASDGFRLPPSDRLGFPSNFEVAAPQRADLLTNSSCVAVDALSHVVNT